MRFDFATTSIPVVLQEKGWDCPDAVELTQWTKLFRRENPRYYTPAIEFKDKELLKMVSNLRHTAVHRLPTTARGISQLLDSAMTFAQHLHDDLRAAQLEELQSEVESKIKAMELNKNVLEDTASSKLQDIQRQREELDRMETKLVKEMLQEDVDNKTLIGQLLEDSVRDIFSLHKGVARRDDAEEKEEDEEEEDDVCDQGKQDMWDRENEEKQVGETHYERSEDEEQLGKFSLISQSRKSE